MASTNFVHQNLVTSIDSSQPCSDGYEVQNLISSNPSSRRRGFLAESFIRSPVSIVLRFVCGIELSHVVLHPNVGSQRSVGFEMHTSILPARADDVENLNLVGKAYLNNGENQVWFVNRKLNHGPGLHPPPENNNLVVVRNVSHHLKQALTCAVLLEIRIVKWIGVCALGGIEVWGWPARNTPNNVLARIRNTWHNSTDVDATNQTKNRPQPLRPVATNTNKLNTNNDVPHDFVDPISCEVMTLPVVLPSGHSVDQLTLEKYLESEASWGRSPNDPFTGLPFVDGRKPLPDAALKARIDSYLLSHPETTKSVGRTVGRVVGGSPNKFHVSTLIEKISRSPIAESSTSFASCSQQSIDVDRVPNNMNEVKKESVRSFSTTGPIEIDLTDDCLSNSSTSNGDVSKPQNKRPLEIDLTQDNVPLVKGERWSSKRNRCDDTPSNVVATHETTLKASLDSSLKTVLGSLTSYTTNSAPKQQGASSQLPKNLSCCEDPSSDTFQLPCSHLLCRRCLLLKCASRQPEMMNCGQCRVQFRPDEPLRVHL